MKETTEYYILPEPSSSSENGVSMKSIRGSINLYFDYDKEGVIFNHGLSFGKVRSHKFTAELHCPAWKIEKSYDSLIKVLDSNEIQSLMKSTPEDLRSSWTLNHYMIYFDSVGCYEIIAESWEILPEKEGPINPV
jgi:hypothetical protein